MEKKNAEFSNEKFNRISENYSLKKKIRTKKVLACRKEYKVLHASVTSVGFTTSLCKIFLNRKSQKVISAFRKSIYIFFVLVPILIIWCDFLFDM